MDLLGRSLSSTTLNRHLSSRNGRYRKHFRVTYPSWTSTSDIENVRLVNTVKTTTPYLTSSTKPLHSLSLKTIGHQDLSFFELKVSSLHQIISCYILWFPRILRVSTNYSAVLSNQLQHLFNSSSSVEARDAYRNNCQWVIMIFKIIFHWLPSNCWNSGSFMGNTSVLMRSVASFEQSITSYFWRIILARRWMNWKPCFQVEVSRSFRYLRVCWPLSSFKLMGTVLFSIL